MLVNGSTKQAEALGDTFQNLTRSSAKSGKL